MSSSKNTEQPESPEGRGPEPVKGIQTWRQYIAELEDYYQDEIAMEDAAEAAAEAAAIAAAAAAYKAELEAEIQRIMKLPSNKHYLILGLEEGSTTRVKLEIAWEKVSQMTDPKNGCKDAGKAFNRAKEAYRCLYNKHKYSFAG